jgi:hypothetical protein
MWIGYIVETVSDVVGNPVIILFECVRGSGHPLRNSSKGTDNREKSQYFSKVREFQIPLDDLLEKIR